MQSDHLSFRDRADAGRQLAQRLIAYAVQNPVVLALPRGGVPVACEVAKALRAPLDLVIVRKIGAPGQAECGRGRSPSAGRPERRGPWTSQGATRLHRGRNTAATQGNRASARALSGGPAARRSGGACRHRSGDGIATGGTVRAALKGVSRAHPARLILAVPVVPADTMERLLTEADEVICLMTPEPFYAVGEHYEDFRQTSDRKVTTLLDEAQRWNRQDGP